jgi:CRP-like cAMP-binding protein
LPSSASNHLLDALPQAEFERLRPHLELTGLPLGQVIYEPGGHLQHALFPTTCVLSLHYVMASGASAETAGVGNEGMVGVALIMGGDTTSSSCMVQTAGKAWRLDRTVLKLEFLRGGIVKDLLLRYTQALINQTMQTAACNRHHSVDQQLCRWLLRTADRGFASELVMTQELVASMLGVRREGISVAAGKLQSAGFIRYRRGHITVLDRKGLESRVCECYAADKREQTRLLPGERYRQGGDSSEPAPACRAPS